MQAQQGTSKIWGLFLFLMVGLALYGAGIMIYNFFAPPIYQRFFDRAVNYEHKQDWENALTEYEKARSEAALHKDDPTASRIELESLKAAADILSIRMGKLDEGAKRYFMLATKADDPEMVQYAIMRLAELFSDYSINCKLSMPFIRQFLEKFPNAKEVPRLLRAKIRCYINNGELEQAVAESREFLKRYPKNPHYMDVLIDMANALFVLERYEEAFTTVGPIINGQQKDVPQSVLSKALVIAGRSEMEQGFFEKALDYFDRAMKITDEPRVVRVYIETAMRLMAQENKAATEGPPKRRRLTVPSSSNSSSKPARRKSNLRKMLPSEFGPPTSVDIQQPAPKQNPKPAGTAPVPAAKPQPPREDKSKQPTPPMPVLPQ